MKNFLSILTILLFDILCIFVSIIVAVTLKNWLNPLFDSSALHDYNNYTEFFLIYFIPIFIFTYQGIYSKRYDFWHESLLIIKSSVLSFCDYFFGFSPKQRSLKFASNHRDDILYYDFYHTDC